jgi:predicted nucleotidyltransferase
LKDNYEATKVILFGSLTTSHFREESDIDLAVKGLALDNYLDIVRKTSEITSPFKVELIPLEEASQALKKRINLEGVEI